MWRLTLARAAATVPLLVLVSVLAFGLIHLMPGSVSEILLGDAATPERVAALNQELGLDEPFLVQYAQWAGDALRGDFGESLVSGRAVATIVMERLPVTLSLAAGGLVVSIVLGVSLGIMAALGAGGRVDRLVTAFSSASLAIPNFWVGMLLAFWIGVRLGLLPASGYTPLTESPLGWLRSLILPSIALGLGASASIALQMRNSLVEVLQRDYIVAARAKGIPSRLVIRRHALRNAANPVATVTGFQVTVMFGGSLVIEHVFTITGLGSAIVPAVLEHDIPVILGVMMVVALAVMLANFIIDVLYGVFDPRVRPA